MITEKAYAKINLILKIKGKTEDNFHNLQTIMAPIDLYDILTFEKNKNDEIVIYCNMNIQNNIALLAAKLFQQKYKTPGVIINLMKKIPLEAGLGGGSADCAAVLRGMNRLFNLNIELKELELLANQLGSDIAFCLYNQLALGEGRGEKLTFLQQEFTHNIFLVKHTIGLKTKDVYDLNQNIATDDLNLEIDFNNLVELQKKMENDLFETALKLHPDLGKIKKEIEEDGYLVYMSGSGPTLYCISTKVEELAFLYKKYLPKYFVFLGKISNKIS